MAALKYLFVIGVCIGHVLTQSIFKKADLEVKTFMGKCKSQIGSDPEEGLNYYRYLVPSGRDSDVLYIGAMNYIFKVNKEFMNCSMSFQREPDTEIARRCRAQGKLKEIDCQNHIRVIMERGSNLLICGTGAYSPTTFVLTTDLLENPTFVYSGMLRCPFDPLDNYTAIQVSGNPGNSTVGYFGTYTDFLKKAPVIYREPYVGMTTNLSYEEKLTDKEINTWLNAPQFVGSFDDQKSVKFFFREVAVEGNDNIYARVAKVCKYDLGGGYTTASKKKWLSFQKARLVCSLPGVSPYYFNDIYDVFERDNQYYALFYKQGANLNASAICIYDINEINNVFNGSYQYKKAHDVWDKLPSRDESNPRLNNCTAYETNPLQFQDKVSEYQLMYDSVKPMFGRPVHYISGVQLLQIAVSKPVYSSNGDISRNIYAASDSGEIYDIYMKNFSSQTPIPFITELNSIYRPFSSVRNTSYAVWDMKFLDDDSLLGFGTDVEVANLNLTKLCSQTTKLYTCIRNTKCLWDGTTRTCKTTKGSVDSGLNKKTYNYSIITNKGVMDSIKSLISAVCPNQCKDNCDPRGECYTTTTSSSQLEYNYYEAFGHGIATGIGIIIVAEILAGIVIFFIRRTKCLRTICPTKPTTCSREKHVYANTQEVTDTMPTSRNRPLHNEANTNLDIHVTLSEEDVDTNREYVSLEERQLENPYSDLQTN